jgi:aryl-alcohol dehydrogenase-like predicted oxidoreductase
VTFIDTADVYGGGSSDDSLPLLTVAGLVTLATKFGIAQPGRPRPGQRPVRGDAAYVRQCIDESLDRLQTDVVDLLHAPA